MSVDLLIGKLNATCNPAIACFQPSRLVEVSHREAIGSGHDGGGDQNRHREARQIFQFKFNLD